MCLHFTRHKSKVELFDPFDFYFSRSTFLVCLLLCDFFSFFIFFVRLFILGGLDNQLDAINIVSQLLWLSIAFKICDDVILYPLFNGIVSLSKINTMGNLNELVLYKLGDKITTKWRAEEAFFDRSNCLCWSLRGNGFSYVGAYSYICQ